MPHAFLITGCSSGFGAEYVDQVLAQGDSVVATARKPAQLKFPAANESNYLVCRLDVTDKASIKAAFKAAIDKFGRVDVVVNNAGYGLAGCFEEYTEEQIRQQMEINFFGLIDVTRTALETMRRQSPPGGNIQQITSVGGQRGVPYFTLYCASKWAVEGFTEALSHELKPAWNIHLTCIEPGGFRTNWAGRSMTFVERKLPEYDHLDAKTAMTRRHGTQAGDPKKGVKVMYEFAIMREPPLRAAVGTDAYQALVDKVEAYEQNYKRWEGLSNSTNVDGYKSSS